jgi:hypothetical protein
MRTSGRPVHGDSTRAGRRGLDPRRARCRRKFLRYFKRGFRDPLYLDWERGYKWTAHERWLEALGPDEMRRLLAARASGEIASEAARIESRTNLLFSFEKMALRDAVRTDAGARAFATGLADYLYGKDGLEARFRRFAGVVEGLPRRQTRVFTWPIVTVFGFLGRPDEHLYLKPTVTKRAAEAYGFDFRYASRPSWETYASLLAFGAEVATDLADLEPRDQIDIQSFIWVLGSDEYPD